MKKITRALSYLVVLSCITFSFMSTRAEALVSPLSVSILPPAQFPKEDFTITGARVSTLFGRHNNVYGLDLGAIGNITTQNFVGLAVAGGFNMTKGTTEILLLQLAGGANINSGKTSIYGVQLALGANINSAEDRLIGLQAAALANLSENTAVYGAQVGLYNRARDVYGLQIGLVNDANSLHGIQIGLVNFNRTGMFAVAPILNIGF